MDFYLPDEHNRNLTENFKCVIISLLNRKKFLTEKHNKKAENKALPESKALI